MTIIDKHFFAEAEAERKIMENLSNKDLAHFLLNAVMTSIVATEKSIGKEQMSLEVGALREAAWRLAKVRDHTF